VADAAGAWDLGVAEAPPRPAVTSWGYSRSFPLAGEFSSAQEFLRVRAALLSPSSPYSLGFDFRILDGHRFWTDLLNSDRYIHRGSLDRLGFLSSWDHKNPPKKLA
jgi:hypothetical protein